MLFGAVLEYERFEREFDHGGIVVFSHFHVERVRIDVYFDFLGDRFPKKNEEAVEEYSQGKGT